jgi:hypothetical protein
MEERGRSQPLTLARAANFASHRCDIRRSSGAGLHACRIVRATKGATLEGDAAKRARLLTSAATDARWKIPRRRARGSHSLAA